MNCEKLIDIFEFVNNCPGGFHHQDHVRLAWLYLKTYALPRALSEFSEDLKAFAAAQGKPDLYNHTLTWAYLFLINERMVKAGTAQDWEEFSRRNRDLLDWENSLLFKYYSKDLLFSSLAKQEFLLPDRINEK